MRLPVLVGRDQSRSGAVFARDAAFALTNRINQPQTRQIIRLRQDGVMNQIVHAVKRSLGLQQRAVRRVRRRREFVTTGKFLSRPHSHRRRSTYARRSKHFIENIIVSPPALSVTPTTPPSRRIRGAFSRPRAFSNHRRFIPPITTQRRPHPSREPSVRVSARTHAPPPPYTGVGRRTRPSPAIAPSISRLPPPVPVSSAPRARPAPPPPRASPALAPASVARRGVARPNAPVGA